MSLRLLIDLYTRLMMVGSEITIVLFFILFRILYFVFLSSCRIGTLGNGVFITVIFFFPPLRRDFLLKKIFHDDFQCIRKMVMRRRGRRNRANDKFVYKRYKPVKKNSSYKNYSNLFISISCRCYDQSNFHSMYILSLSIRQMPRA